MSPCIHCESENVEKRGRRNGKHRLYCQDCGKWSIAGQVKRSRRLFFDIETSPNVGLFWNPGRKINIPHDNIIKERAIICIAWKWGGEKAVHALTWDANQCDKKLVKEFVNVMNEADELVGHNGDNFDIKWVRTRALVHGIQMDHTLTSQDTLKLAKSKFRFNSNRLDYIADFLGFGNKKAVSYDLWKSILLNKDKKALDEMVAYCKHDVVLLENIWNKLMPFVPAKSSVTTNISNCPECGSSSTIVNKRRVTAHGYRKVSFVCRDCGKYHTVSESRFEKGKANV